MIAGGRNRADERVEGRKSREGSDDGVGVFSMVPTSYSRRISCPIGCAVNSLFIYVI